MNRKHLHGALLLAAASLLAVGAYAQNPHAAPQGKANAADKGDKDKDKDKSDKAAKDAKGNDGKEAVDPSKGKTEGDRAARKAKEHDAQREKLRTMLKGPVNDGLKQELKRHADRVARLERIKVVAQTEKDNDNVEKATKLLAKENERHDKWMDKNVLGAAPVPAATDVKGGAK